MAIKVYKPTINSRRNMSVIDYSSLSKVAPEKSLLAPLNKKAGRNSYGRITVRHRGGGNRRKYRIIDSSTIPTVPRLSRWLSTQTATRLISLLPRDLRLATR